MVMPFSRADALQHVGRLLHLGVVEAAEALVGQQQLRLRRERAGQLELLQRRGAEPVGGARARRSAARPVASASSAWRQHVARAIRCGPGRRRPTARRSRAAISLRNGRGIWKVRADALVADAVRRQAADLLALEADRAGGRRVACPAMQLKVVLLPEPFGPIRPRISPSSTVEGHVVDGGEAAERLVRPETAAGPRVAHRRRDGRRRLGPATARVSARRRGPSGSGSTGVGGLDRRRPDDLGLAVDVLHHDRRGALVLARPSGGPGGKNFTP